jgi:predicted secreted hydrolase
VLHDHDGFVDFAEAGSSYYYSRTRLTAAGSLTVDGATFDVEGIAWFDHQWGDFISVGRGGWNWFAINLDDGTDITVSDVIDEQASSVLTYGTVVTPDGTATRIDASAIRVGSGGFGGWTSPTTGRTWTTHWTIAIAPYFLNLDATVQDQELDTRATTGVVYWEGSHLVNGVSGDVVDVDTGELVSGAPVAGDAYVEITRYGPVAN